MGLAFLLLGGGIAGAFLMVGIIVRPAPERLPMLSALLVGFALLLMILLAVLWAALDRRLMRPLIELTDATRLLLLGKQPPPIATARFSMMDDLSENVRLMAADLQQSRQDVSRAMASGAVGLQDERKRLQAVLSDLDDGAVICDREGGILLFNRTAGVLHGPALQVGGSIYTLWPRASLEQNVRALKPFAPDAPSQPPELPEFLCATLDSGELMRCRLRLLPTSAALRPGFLLLFRPASRLSGDLPPQPNLQAAVESLRSPLASLRAAAENLAREQSISLEDRERFQGMIVRESRELSRRVDWIGEASQRVLSDPARMADVRSSDLLAHIRSHPPGDHDLPSLCETGSPLWLHMDGYAAGRMLGYLLHRLKSDHGVSRIEIETLPGDHRVYVDLRWQGEPAPVTSLEAWLEDPLPGGDAQLTGRMVLESHGSVCWSQWDKRRAGISVLRIPLPCAQGCRSGWSATSRQTVPDHTMSPGPGGGKRSRSLPSSPLPELEYTALAIRFAAPSHSRQHPHPREITALRITKGRPAPGSRLDVTVGANRGESPLDDALVQLQAFARDTVLIGHGSGPAMQMLHMHGPDSGAVFDHPVLDLASLSALLHGPAADHSLESLCWRMGLEPDAGTPVDQVAEIFCRMLPLLHQQGIERLEQALHGDRQREEAPQAGEDRP